MKHNINITFILLFFFILSQLFGLFVISYDMTKEINQETNESVIVLSETAIGERPELSGIDTIIFLSFAIFFGTILILILAKFKKRKLWKAWFFLAIWMTISITLGVFFNNPAIYLVSLVIALWKVFKPNFYIHNISEIMIYSGIAFLMTPLLNVFWGVVLLLLISLYDAFAVWQSKHMIKLAIFQRDSKVFAGLNINYDQKKGKILSSEKLVSNNSIKKVKTKKTKASSAVLGGGDMAFPLIFSGTMLMFLFNEGFSKISSYFITLPITLFATAGLGLLLYFGKKERFYPAMPFISAGCFIGLGISFLIKFLL
jgi:presenilin-like A22 family membrane protease